MKMYAERKKWPIENTKVVLSHSRGRASDFLESGFKAGKVEFRTDAGGNVHAPLGKRSFSTEDLVENLSAFMNHLSGMRPAAVKGNFVRRISVSTTMSPGAFIEYGG